MIPPLCHTLLSFSVSFALCAFHSSNSFCPSGLSKNFGFREVSTGQGLLFHAGGYLYPVAFCHISPFSVFSCQGTIPLCGVKCFLPSITVPFCAAVGVSVLPVPPVGYGQPAAECRAARFPALPVPSYLSSCLFAGFGSGFQLFILCQKVVYRDLVFLS